VKEFLDKYYDYDEDKLGDCEHFYEEEHRVPAERRGSFADNVRRYSNAAIDSALNVPSQVSVSVSTNPAEAPVSAPTTTTNPTTSSITLILSSAPQAHTSYFIQYNKKSLLITLLSLLILLLILPLTTLLCTKLNWTSPAYLYAFEGMIVIILELRFMRRKDEKFVREYPATFVTSFLTSALMLNLANGDSGYLTLVLIVIMFTMASAAVWVFEKPRPNILVYVLYCVPTAVVSTVVAFLPSFAVAIPGIALAQKPLLYSAWCGVGFPMLTLFLRIFTMNYFSNYVHTLVKQKRMAPSGVIPYLSTVSFMLGVTVLCGNTMLLYLSKNVSYAASSSAFAILTEVAGKVYSVYIIITKTKVKRKLRRKARRIAVGSDADTNADTYADTNAGADADADAEAVAEENKKQEEQMLMFSVRLANEIVAEKTCIIVCAFINFVKFVPTIHSTDTITLFAVIFFFTELIADALLVYVLVEYFAVPMLRLPVEKFEWRSVEFWSGVMEVALIPVGATLFFLHAFISSNEWLA
jgi:hypothetical protein